MEFSLAVVSCQNKRDDSHFLLLFKIIFLTCYISVTSFMCNLCGLGQRCVRNI